MTATDPDSAAVARFLERLQDDLCAQLGELEPDAEFDKEVWRHARDGDDGDGDGGGDGISGGGGVTRVIEGGAVFEKGGVNFSRVTGESLPPAATATTERAHLAGRPFEAMGVSLVLHPRNPFVPCCHFNLRFFLADARATDAAPAWWFGGGYDLTPYYGFDEDCIHWHQTAKDACDRFDRTHYPRFKAWCDRYFYLPHRGEARGIGGLFFDDYRDGGFARAFAFAQVIGGSFIDAYRPLALRRCDTPHGERQRRFQQYRRGRYVEFNLVYDRGTLFGLQSGGRIESILMSLPPTAHWRYDWRAEPGSDERRLTDYYLKPRDWLG